jgi:hypothetical protein
MKGQTVRHSGSGHRQYLPPQIKGRGKNTVIVIIIVIIRIRRIALQCVQNILKLTEKKYYRWMGGGRRRMEIKINGSM